MKQKAPLPWMKIEPMQSAPAPLQVNLTRLAPGKKRDVWQRIKQHSPATAELLTDSEFKQSITEIEKVFGAVDIKVDLDVLGDSQ